MSSVMSENGVGIEVVMEAQEVSIEVDTAKRIGLSWVWCSKFVLLSLRRNADHIVGSINL